MERRYKLYLASGIRLWNLYFKDQFSPYFNKKLDLFEPALIDNQYTRDHRLIPIKIATKDLGEINKCDAVLAYMKIYDTQNNGPAGTDSSWECGYAIGLEKPTIMLVENLEHLDYYTSQWMITFSIGAILTTNREVMEKAKNSDKFTHTRILYCENKNQFENKIIEYLDSYYKSIYAREGIINSFVDQEMRSYADSKKILGLLGTGKPEPAIYKNFTPTPESPRLPPGDEWLSGSECRHPKDRRSSKEAPASWPGSVTKNYDRYFDQAFQKPRKFLNLADYRMICRMETERARTVKAIISNNHDLLPGFLDYCIHRYTNNFEGEIELKDVAKMIEYWLSIPAKKIKGRRQGNKKTRPTIFYELYDLVSHHMVKSKKYFPEGFVYKIGAIIEIYNWLNTYAIDDVFDNSLTRQGNKTLHIKYKSRKNALLLGAIGHCIALKLLYLETFNKMEIGKELIKSLNQVQETMYQGQLVDISLTFDNKKHLQQFIRCNTLTSVLKLYFKRIYGICGAFYEQIGRMAMQSTDVSAQFYHKEEVEEACVYIAKLFGLVQMIRNDLGDFIFPELHSKLSKGMKSSSHNDIAEGKLTLPLLYTLFTPYVGARDKQKLLDFFNQKGLNKVQKLEISRIIWESGAIEFCMKFVENLSKQVTEQYVKYIHETPTRLKWIIKLMDITPLINKTFKQLALKRKWNKLEPEPLNTAAIEKMINQTFKIF